MREVQFDEFVFSLGSAVVNFTVSYSTASSNDVIIVPVNGTVSFEDGDTSVPLNITIVDDSMPELSEELHIQLVSVTGKGTNWLFI